MKVLCLMAGQPGPEAIKFIEALNKGAQHALVSIDLAAGGLSYDEVVRAIFEADRVVSWP